MFERFGHWSSLNGRAK